MSKVKNRDSKANQLHCSAAFVVNFEYIPLCCYIIDFLLAVSFWVYEAIVADNNFLSSGTMGKTLSYEMGKLVKLQILSHILST